MSIETMAQYMSEKTMYFSNILNKRFGIQSDPYEAVERIIRGTDVNGDTMGSLLGNTMIINSPWQFNKYADPRNVSAGSDTDSALGRVYADKYYRDLPLVIFSPGKPSFQFQFDENGVKEYIKLMGGSTGEGSSDNGMHILNNMKNSPSRYYDHIPDKSYFDYVAELANELLETIKDSKEFDSEVISQLEKAVDKSFTSIMGFERGPTGHLSANRSIFAIVADVSTSTSESGSNDTSESQLGSALKGVGSTKKELDFVLGMHTRDSEKEMEKFNQRADAMYAKADKQSIYQAMIGKTKNFSETIINGGNILFPEIWSDSSYRKSYSMTFKLISPYGNIASIFWSIYVPLLHLIALSMPRQNSLNGYDSPYILKCFSKGWFACDMGIVESIDVKKPDVGHWTAEGLPTQLEVTLTIKDLYPTIMMTHKGLGSIHKYNTGLIEYMNVLANVNFVNENAAKRWIHDKKVFVKKLFSIPSRLEDGSIKYVTSAFNNWLGNRYQ